MSADDTLQDEQRDARRLPDDSGWEAKVINRLRARMEELSRRLGSSVDTCHFSWETRPLEILRERLRENQNPGAPR